MKTSERLYMRSRHAGCMSALTFSASCAIAFWTPSAFLSGETWGCVAGITGGVLGLLGIAMSLDMALDAYSLSRKAGREARIEWEREVRPRL